MPFPLPLLPTAFEAAADRERGKFRTFMLTALFPTLLLLKGYF